jgi:hypothetical protein
MQPTEDRIAQLEAAMELVADDEAVFVHRSEGGIGVAILLNDVIGYATAYAVEVPWEEVVSLLACRRREGWPALIRWAAEREGWTPIPPVQDSMAEHDIERGLQREAQRLIRLLLEGYVALYPGGSAALSENPLWKEARAFLDTFTEGGNPGSH